MTKKKYRNGGYRIHVLITSGEMVLKPLRGYQTPDLSLGPVIHCDVHNFKRAMEIHDSTLGQLDLDENHRWFALVEEIERLLPVWWIDDEWLQDREEQNGKTSGEEVPC